MSPRAARRRRSWRPAAALLAGCALALGLPAGLAPTSSADEGDATGSPSITVTALAPEVARPGQTLQLRGTVRSGAEALDDAVVQVRVGAAPLVLRDQLADVAEGRATPVTTPVATEPAPADQAPDTSRAWSLSAELDTLALPQAGAYPLIVDLVSKASGAALTSTTTFLSWYPTRTVAQPTRVVWALPLIGTPARDADGVFVDDRTATAVAPGGRLRTLLDAGTGTAASWLVDPELLQAVEDMADGYEVRGDDGQVRPGGAAGQTAAARFLADVRAALARADVSALGYADPDLNALVRAGLGEDVTRATTAGPAVAAGLLDRDVRGNLAWPPGGVADRSTLRTLRAAGVSAVLLSDLALPADPALTFTPTGLERVPVVGGAMTAVLSDHTLDAVVGTPSTQGGYTAARARYLAETLVITQQRPSDPRTVVVAPPRGWDVDGGFARSLLTAGVRVPWIDDSTVTTLLREEPPAVTRGPLTLPEGSRRAEISGAQLDGARQLGRDIERFTGVLADPSATTTRYTAAQLRTESAAFRTQRAAGASLLRAVESNLERDHAKVSVISRGTVRLSGASGQVPLTVANDLDQSVIVRVRLVPSSAVKLRVDQPAELRLGPRKKETIEVQARAATSGTVPVEIVLLTREGSVYSEPVTLQVSSTAYSRVGLVIVVLAGGALLLLMGARVVRRVRRGRATADAADDDVEVRS